MRWKVLIVRPWTNPIDEIVAAVSRAGIDAVLVGEALMRAEDMGARVRELADVERFKVQGTKHLVQE